MKCPTCQTNQAKINSTYGVMSCQTCCDEDILPNAGIEFTTDSIKDQRREYYSDIVQSHRGGILSKEYLEQHGTKNIKVTPQEVKDARYVWKETKGWHNRDKSK